jgi:2-hydroxychromene-2-carboxylate isomerase
VTIADWYFDFVSPFSYLQCERLPAFAPSFQVRCKPVVFGAILAAHDNKGPAEVPGKRDFTYRHAYWRAQQAGIPLKFPHVHPFNSLPLLRLAIVCDSSFAAVQQIFRFVWRDGRLPDLPIEWAELAQVLGVPDADSRITSSEVKDELRRNTDEALARGVFGVPTLAVNNEMFWGDDATDMAVAYAADGGRYTDPEYARIAAIPPGVERKLPGRK